MKCLFRPFLVLLFLVPLLQAEPNAFCSVPVADLVGISMYHAQKQGLPVQTYDQQPFADKPGDFACTRLTQILFNEQVEIIDQLADEYKIKISHWYHQAGNPPQKITTYWVDKKAITPFKKLNKESLTKLPQPISFTRKTIPTYNIVTLTNGYKNYSAGTRFVKAPQQPKKGNLKVYAYQPDKGTFQTIFIPHSVCIEKPPKTARAKRKFFVKLLKQWAHQESGDIPYVFGGASIGRPLETDRFIERRVKTPRKLVTLFERTQRNKKPTKTGIDCAHTIARAAQIAGINYFVKNTTTLTQTLAHLTPQQTIEDGDILVWKGHTVVVSNAKKGLLIEARGYEHGYGVVQEIPFKEQFKGIATTAELKKAYLNKQNITRLNKAGESIQTIYDLAIIKLPVT